MKIISRKEFLKLPSNTVFSKYKPCVFESLEIKGDTVADMDFRSQQISDAVDDSIKDRLEILESAENLGLSFRMDFDSDYRDGLFDEDQLFAVWEKEDVKMLMDRLAKCL